MAITYPYAVTALADLLRIESVTWDIQRNDELSGVGDGRVWQAEMSDPLWTADVRLAINYHNPLKQVAALIRKLHGAQESFFLFDPTSPYPQADPTGAIIGSSSVQIHSVGSGRSTLRLKGLPAAYILTLGDKMQITFGTTQTYFAEVSETVTADGSGITAEFAVFPHVPLGVAANDAVNLKKPACKGFIMPGSHNPGTSQNLFTSGAGFTFVERRR